MNRSETIAFFTATLLYYSAAYLTAFCGGLLVERRGLKVNYTRKINHFVTMCLPWLFQQLFGLQNNLVAAGLAAVFTPAHLALYVRPIRERVPAVATMFRSQDRPEDRPHTLSWLATQYIAVYAVYLAPYPVMMSSGATIWMGIVIAVNAIGDGLAEPVGVAFGRHPYGCYGLFCPQKYHRTWEGSACVFVSGVIAICVCRHTFNPLQFAIALILVPISSTIAEAVSPHTWDAPFLFLIVSMDLVLVAFL